MTQVPSPKAQLLSHLLLLAEARDEFATLDTELKESKRFILDKWEQENAADLEWVSTLNAEVVAIDAVVRQNAELIYNDTNDKYPAPGVGIRVIKQVVYPETSAVNWAIENCKTQFLKLDKTAFDKHAKAVADTDPLPFCYVKEIPQVTISKNLEIDVITDELEALAEIEKGGESK